MLRVLCLEDVEEDYELITYVLRKNSGPIVSVRVDTREGFLQNLFSFKADVILSDHSLPQFNSIEALQLKKSSGIDVPFILVTGAVSDEFAVTCLKEGADDYVLKQNLKNLPSVVANALRSKEEARLKEKAIEELANKNEELTKANKELDAFLYSVSHNLRSPINSVQGLLNLCRNEKDPGMLKVYHDLMEKSIARLDQNVVEVLEYARNSKQQLKIEMITFDKIINENIERMKYMDAALDINFEVNIQLQVPFYSDQYRIQNIINNFISNAIKYQDKNKPSRFVKIDVKGDEEKILLEFQDNGIGIPGDRVDQVFEMFFRATGVQTGVGLGLHIVKDAVQILNGVIEVHSTEGKGTTFNLVLPNLKSQSVDIVERQGKD
jgi:signal transduction histidine kinase